MMENRMRENISINRYQTEYSNRWKLLFGMYIAVGTEHWQLRMNN